LFVVGRSPCREDGSVMYTHLVRVKRYIHMCILGFIRIFLLIFYSSSSVLHFKYRVSMYNMSGLSAKVLYSTLTTV